MAEEIQKRNVTEIGKVTHSDGVVLGVQGGKAVSFGVNEVGGLVTTDKVNENLTFGEVKEGDSNVISGGDVFKVINDLSNNYINEFNINQFINGGYVNFGDGSIIASPNHSYSDFIEIQNGKTYELSDTEYYYAFYNVDKIFITNQYASYRSGNFIPPTNAKYIRVSNNNSELSDFYLKEVLSNNNNNDVLISNLASNETLVNRWFDGGYASQDNGIAISIAGFSYSNFIELASGKKYSLSPELYQQYAFYDENGSYVPDTQSANGFKTFVKPVSAKYIRISKENTQDNKLIFNDNFDKENKILHVGEGRTFETIQSAVNYAISTNERIVLEIDNGVFSEELNLYQNGVAQVLRGKGNTETVIYSNGAYEPVKMKAGFYCQDLKIQIGGGGGYALHHDYAGNGVTQFVNCDFETTTSSVIGVGMHANQKLIFRNCRFYQIGGADYGTGTLYMHNFQNNAKNQRIEFWNCEVYSDNQKSIRIDDATQIQGTGDTSPMTVLFVGNTFYSQVYGVNENNFIRGETSRGVGMLVGNNVVLDPMSHGNTIEELNSF